MLNISEYIRDVLLFQEKLTISGLGTFELIRKSAVLEDREILPPASYIIFNPDIAGEDNTLASNIADAEEIEFAEANERVLEYINEIRLTLNRGEIFSMEGFGKFFLDANNKYVFEKDENIILDFETSGFESFELEAVDEGPEQEAVDEGPEQEAMDEGPEQEAMDEGPEQEAMDEGPEQEAMDEGPEQEAIAEGSEQNGDILPKSDAPEDSGDNVQTPGIDEPPHHEPVDKAKPPLVSYDLIEEKRSNRNFIRILSGSVVVILISFIILALTTDLLDNLSTTLFKTPGKSETVTAPPAVTEEPDEYERNMEAAIDSLTRLEHALRIPGDIQQELIVPSLYSEYHIIAGSFSSPKNADELQKELSLQGFPTRIIDRGDGFYRVSALSFSDKEKALQELEAFRENTSFKSAWVLGLK